MVFYPNIPTVADSFSGRDISGVMASMSSTDYVVGLCLIFILLACVWLMERIRNYCKLSFFQFSLWLYGGILSGLFLLLICLDPNRMYVCGYFCLFFLLASLTVIDPRRELWVYPAPMSAYQEKIDWPIYIGFCMGFFSLGLYLYCRLRQTDTWGHIGFFLFAGLFGVMYVFSLIEFFLRRVATRIADRHLKDSPQADRKNGRSED